MAISAVSISFVGRLSELCPSPLGCMQKGSGGTPPGQNQVEPPKGFSLKVDFRMVSVDAIVRTRQGSMAGNMQVSDFLVYDDDALMPTIRRAGRLRVRAELP